MTSFEEALKIFYTRVGQRYLVQTQDGSQYLPMVEPPQDGFSKHLNGEITLALNLVSPEGLVKTLVVDFDGVFHAGQGSTTLEALKRLYEALMQELELPEPAISVSGRKGYGLWLSLAEPIPATQAQAFLRGLKAVYLANVSHVDLRPDCSEPTKAAQAVVKLPPCLHRSNNKWSAFINIEEAHQYIENPWLDNKPDLQKQAGILGKLRSITATEFSKAFNILKNKLEELGLSKTEFEKQAPDFSQAPSKEYLPPCVKFLVEQGVPDGMDYHTANLNLANYGHSANLTRENTLKLVSTMSDNTPQKEGRSKSKQERINHFNSIQPKDFYCNFPRGIDAWRKAYGGKQACNSCSLNTTKVISENYVPPDLVEHNKENIKGKKEEASKEAPLKSLILRKEVALDLIKYSWEHGVDISHIQGVLPYIEIPYKFNFKLNSRENEPKERNVVLDWFKLTASISNKELSNAGFFQHLETYIHNHCSYSYVRKQYKDKNNIFLIETEDNTNKIYFIGETPRELALKHTQVFFDEIHARKISKQQGEKTLEQAEAAEAKYKVLSEALSCASNPHDSTSEVISKVEGVLNKISKTQVKECPIQEQKKALFFEIFKPRPSVETPFEHLNYRLEGGFQAGRMYVLIATPKSGKTTFAANCMDFAAANGHPVLYMGYEMGKAQLMLYGLSRKTEINASKIQTVRLTEEEQERVLMAFNSYAENEGKNLTLVEAGDTYTFSNAVVWVCLNNNIETNGKVPFVVIDYLQIAFSGKKEVDQNASASERVGQLAVMCKRIAREHKVALLVLSSVTKVAETDSNNKGKMDVTAARDSLAIIHAADGVMALQSNQITIKNKQDGKIVTEVLDPWQMLERFCEDNGSEQEAEQIRQNIEKHGAKYPQQAENVRAVLYLERHRGSTGQVPLYYRKAIHKFEEVALSNMHKNFYEKGDPTNLLEKADTLFKAEREELAPPQTLPSCDIKPIYHEPAITEQEPINTQVAYQYITHIETARTEIEGLQETIALDLETTGLDPITSQIRLLSLHDGNKTLIIDLFKSGSIHTLEQSLKQKKLVGHNSIFDMQFLKQAGVEVLMDCTMIAYHVLTGEQKKLQDLSKIYLEVEMNKEQQKSDWGLDNLSKEQLQYSALDVIRTFEIWSKIKPELKENKFVKIYTTVRNAQPAVVQMQLTGVVFDKQKHAALLSEIENKKTILQSNIKEALNDINYTSSKQLGEWLKEKLGGENATGFKNWEKTSTGKLKTGADELKKFARLLPEEARKVIEDTLIPIKKLEKYITSFGISLSNKINPITGRIHPEFNLIGARTGRASCANPNFQQIPRDKTFRELFRAQEGFSYIIADYSQIELRVVAELANETKMLEGFKNGRDVHRSTAALLLNKTYEEVPEKSAMRSAAKAVNFGLLYGMGARGLQSYAQDNYGVIINEKQAKQYIASFFQGYLNIKKWREQVQNTTQRTLFMRTPLGRVRRWNRKNFKATEALNTPVQAGAAEIMLLALSRLYEHLKPFNAKMLAFIHDEVIVECLEAEASSVLEVVKEQMTQAALEVFPNIAVNGLIGSTIARNWGEK